MLFEFDGVHASDAYAHCISLPPFSHSATPGLFRLFICATRADDPGQLC